MKNILKIISIQNIIESLKNAFKRFPAAMIVASAWTVTALFTLHTTVPVEKTILPKLLMLLGLAFVLFIALILAKEQQRWAKKKETLVHSGVVAFLLAYFVLLPQNFIEAESIFIIRHIMWMVGFILLVTFIPFIKNTNNNKINAFWHYNVLLVLSMILTIFWAGAIQLGLSIAMGSIDFLFDIDIDGDRYLELWLVLVGIFGTTFFVSRLPGSMDEFYTKTDYPNELRLFSQYVLVPLVTLYFLILYAYVIRIIISGIWPEGTLAYMILGFSFLAVLTYILLYPLRDTVNWVKKSGNIFFIILIPQVLMLFWALWFRITEYGITEKRYLVFVFGIWLFAIALYFISKRTKDIRMIPMTIFAIALFTSFGPWGAFSVSETSQVNRLEKLLVSNSLLINGTIQKAIDPESIPSEDSREISAVFRYLNQIHGYDKIQPWFTENLEEYIKDEKGGRYKYERPRKIVEDIIGIVYVEAYERFKEGDDFFFMNVDFENMQNPLTITGFDTLLQIQSYRYESEDQREGLYTTLDTDTSELVLNDDERELARISLTPIIEKARNKQKQNFSRDELTLYYNDDSIRIQLLIDNINGEKNNDGTYHITSLNGKLLFSILLRNQ